MHLYNKSPSVSLCRNGAKKTFKCTECDFRSEWPQSITKHKRACHAHAADAKKRFVCEHCDRKVRGAGLLAFR